MGISVACDIDIRIEDDLGDTGVIPKINENQASVVTASVNPAHQSDRLAFMCFAQIAAVMSSRRHVNVCWSERVSKIV